MRQLFLGVDAGGTKTTAVIATSDGEVLTYGVGGPANILEDGEDKVRRSLKKAVSDVLKAYDEVNFSVFGLPVIGEVKGIEDTLSNIIKEELNIKPDLLVNDVVVGWAGGTGCNDGIHVVAGTGTIAYGRKGETSVRIGGWGSLADDEGSAYYIGIETMRECFQQSDGRKPRTQLIELVFDSLELSDIFDLCMWVNTLEENERRNKIAGIAPITLKAALRGDRSASEILGKSGAEIARLAITGVKRLHLDDPLITYSGGVLLNNEIVRASFEKEIEKVISSARIRKPLLSPALGAILLCFEQKGIPIDDVLINTLKKVDKYDI